MDKFIFSIKILTFLTLAIFLNSCEAMKYKPTKAGEVPVNAKDRVKKNIEEGRGFRIMGNNKGGTFDFASSNELWRATLDTIDFMPLVSANYSGGIIITDWYSSEGNLEESIKISIRFLTNEIRSDSLDIKIFYKKCAQNANCAISEKKGSLVTELNKKILNRAAIYAKQNKDKNFKKYNPGPKSQNN